MRQIRHPLVRSDVVGIFDHVLKTTHGDLAAAERRLDEIDALLQTITDNPTSGIRLDGALTGWLVRYGGCGRSITTVFRPDVDSQCLFIALVGFGGRDWLQEAVGRGRHPEI